MRLSAGWRIVEPGPRVYGSSAGDRCYPPTNEGSSRAGMNDLQAYMVYEYVSDYKAGHLSRRDLVRRVLYMTGGVASTATVLATLGCAPSQQAAPTTAPPAAPKPTTSPAASPAASPSPSPAVS